uniref:Uncharacterized protein n=1 Tax=Rhizophora mucronata TaxID=61149 RepID=A0A2P2QHL0_RHIMU
MHPLPKFWSSVIKAKASHPKTVSLLLVFKNLKGPLPSLTNALW